MKAKDLKNAILQMAIQGTLVPQDPSDEPASVLLERIREERAELIREKKIKAPKGGESIIYRTEDGSYYEKRVDAKGRESEPVCIDDEIPFEIPESWEWTRLDNVADYKKGPFGSSLTKAMFIPDGETAVKVYEQINAIQKNENLGTYFISQDKFESMRNFEVHPGDIIISCAGTIGESFVLPPTARPGIINQALMRVSLFDRSIKSFYLLYFDFIIKFSAQSWSKGSAIKNIPPFAILKQMLIPIPPLAEQHRIVEQNSKLMPLVEEYGKLETAREKLDAELPDKLHKSVLQMAIQGTLVPQDPSDEPASVLLARIREQRARLIREKKIKTAKGGESVIYRAEDGSYYEKRIDAKGKVISEICIDDEIPFEIPETWEWARLGEIGNWKAGATPAKSNPKYHQDGDIPWLLTGDLNDSIVTEIPNRITKLAVEECSVRVNPIGTVLVAMYGATIGKFGILGIPSTTNQACCACILHNEEIRDWLVAWLMFYKPYFKRLGEGGAQPNISRGKIISRLLPVPPLAEQHRIVKRVAELMPLIEGFSKLDS